MVVLGKIVMPEYVIEHGKGIVHIKEVFVFACAIVAEFPSVIIPLEFLGITGIGSTEV